jgi:hypothetical protein
MHHTLCINMRSFVMQRIDTPMLPTKFMFLKYLLIDLDTEWSSFPSYDYFSLASFLDASPLLETFILNVRPVLFIPSHKDIWSLCCIVKH